MPRKKQKPLPPDFCHDQHDQPKECDPPRIEVPGDDDTAGVIDALVASNCRLSAQVAACDARAFLEMDRARVLEMQLSQAQAVINANAYTIQSLVADAGRMQMELAQRVAHSEPVTHSQLQHHFDRLHQLLFIQEVGCRVASDDVGDHRAVVMGRLEAADMRVFGQRGRGCGEFLFPQFVAFDDDGNIAVSDSGNNRIQVLQYSDGQHLRTIGRFGDGDGEFNFPADIAFDRSGHLVVADCDNHRVQVFRYRDGQHVLTFGSKGSSDGKFKYPSGVAIDTGDNIVVHDGHSNGRIQIFRLRDGAFLRKLCNWGCGNAQLQGWGCLEFVEDGCLVVSDSKNGRIQVLRYSDGVYLRTIGNFGADTGKFRSPLGIAVDQSGLLYVVDSGNHRVQVLRYRDGVHIRSVGVEGSGLGQLQRPCGIALDGDRMFVCDSNNSRVCVLR